MIFKNDIKILAEIYSNMVHESIISPNEIDTRHANLEQRAKSGDKDAYTEAQKIVDDAAKNAGYKVGPVWHGTKNSFTVFKDIGRIGGDEYGRGFYFTETKEGAFKYGNRVVSAYLKLENPLSVGGAFADGDLWVKTNAETRADISTNAKKMGHDGIIRWRGQIENSEMREIVIFTPSQIKSADPFTYYDDGTLIPISKRFNQKNDDIRI